MYKPGMVLSKKSQQTPQPAAPKLTDRQLSHKNARTGLTVMAAILFMTALTFASVPLYRLFCQVTGFNGTPQTGASLPGKIVDRSVTIKFNADVGRGLNWDFNPEMRQINVKLGEKGLTAFHARNKENRPGGGTALYNVTPLKAGKYFHKIQCFCFDEQILGPRQEVAMPVMFYVDPALDDDPNMADVHVITLSYTFYPAESKELEDALQAFYNEGASAIQGTN